MNSDPNLDLEKGRLVLGRYTILGKLTQGGMAEVYLARQKGPAGYQKLVVIKRVRPHLASDDDFVAMFVNEARLAALINHPNVVSIFDLGNEEADWFLAMEYLDGRDMLQVGRACRQHNKAVPFDVTARIIADACAGLDHAHGLRGTDGQHLNLVHRDMSPENVLITFDGAVKVLDFGIAKARDNQLRTQAGQIKGKLGYVAPEAIMGQPLDARADIFAIGATLYLFLCGRPAFSGANPVEVFEKSLKPPVPPTTLNPQVPKSLEKICLRCLQQDRSKRYQDAGQLRDALENHLAKARRALGPAQLSQFMKILFPPQSDPDRKRTEELIDSADPAPPPSTVPTRKKASRPAEQSAAEATAIVSEAQLKSTPLTVDLPSEVQANSAYHLRSVELADEIDRKKRPRAAPAPIPDATINRPPVRTHAETVAQASATAAPVAESYASAIDEATAIHDELNVDGSLDMDIDFTDEGGAVSETGATALPDFDPMLSDVDAPGMTVEAALPGFTSDSLSPSDLQSDEDELPLPDSFPPPTADLAPPGNDTGLPPHFSTDDVAPPPPPGIEFGGVASTEHVGRGPPAIPTDATSAIPVAPPKASLVKRLAMFGAGFSLGLALVVLAIYLIGDLDAVIAYVEQLAGAAPVPEATAAAETAPQ